MVDIPVTNKSRIEITGNAPPLKTEALPVPIQQTSDPLAPELETSDRPTNIATTPAQKKCTLKSISSGKQRGQHLRGSFCPDRMTGTSRDDYLWGRDKADELRGRGGDDILKGGIGHDALLAGAGQDLVLGHQGRDLLRGGSGHDMLRGHRGRDTLKGGPGEDILSGGRRRDTLIGGADADLFRISRGRDRIQDFDPAEGDRIATRSRFDLHAKQQGNHLQLRDRSQNILTTLHNTSLEALLDAQPDLLS